jgi:hypothetical protein
MSLSDLLFIGATIAWGQALTLRQLGMYAASVSATFLGKLIWEKYAG